MKDVQLARLRLTRTPGSPGGIDGYGFRVDAFEYVYTGAEPVTLEVEVSDTTRTTIPVSDAAFQLLVLEALDKLLGGRIDNYGPPAIEQLRAMPQPIVLERERFPDNL